MSTRRHVQQEDVEWVRYALMLRGTLPLYCVRQLFPQTRTDTHTTSPKVYVRQETITVNLHCPNVVVSRFANQVHPSRQIAEFTLVYLYAVCNAMVRTVKPDLSVMYFNSNVFSESAIIMMLEILLLMTIKML